MKRNTIFLITLLFSILLLNQKLNAQSKERSEVDPKYTWDLSPIFPDVDTWKKSKESVQQRILEIEKYKGKISESADQLLACLLLISDIDRNLARVSLYSSMNSDLDTRKSEPMSMNQEVGRIYTQFNTSTAFVEPEILSIPKEKLENFMKQKEELKLYKLYLDNIQRMQAHTLSAAEEDIIAKAGLMTGIASNIHRLLANADIQWEKVTLSDGRVVEANEASYIGLRGNPNRADRIAVFNGFYNTLKKYSRTFGAMLYGKTQENLFYKNARKYNSILEATLYRKNIPTTVYTSLIENNHKHLDNLHRYLKIRKRMLGVDELHYYDMYPDLVKGEELKYNFEEAKELFVKAVVPLGEEYISTLKKAFNSRWVDVYPTVGKTSGNYSNSSYDVHPYVFLNFTGRYPDVSMLAHEMGHAMHSYFSNKTQPLQIADYSNFVAEVASTTNEALLQDYVIKTVKDPKQKLSLIGNILESMRQTMFRQILFAEYELVINQLAEKGESLTGDKFTEIYLGMLRKYYGQNEGITVIDDLFGYEWGYISHFFLGFYNYQYATSYTAALALAEKMSTGGKPMVDRYINFLSSGGSKYPIDLLKDLGIDMTSSEPFDLAMVKMSKYLDEMESLLKEIGK